MPAYVHLLYRQRRAAQQCSLEYDNGVLVYRTPYMPALVAELKLRVPASDRRWDAERKVWLVAPQHAATLVRLTEQHLGETITAPAVPRQVAVTETRILDVRYIGTTKDRGDGERSAFGWVGGSWAAIFAEKALREWFSADTRPDESPTLYAVLGVPAVATPDELKGAYRRLARTWHPDVCHEPDAKEQFQRIQHAYEILRAPGLRARYDAGRALEASVRDRPGATAIADMTLGYRSPLRCGLIMCEGHEVLGRFIVNKIIMWQDIIDAQGRVLCTSWPMGAEKPEEVWS
jgi:hypothetical protein